MWLLGAAVAVVAVAVVALAVRLQHDRENDLRLAMLAAEIHAFRRVARRRV
ncbi:hypothetical protein [Actinopolymorpha pittospori]|uniref:Signal transduction histidine kinase n=1 Tax=Actinopolymorpha pittospori TaxID=648752 RepID=A0A927RP99_9ACTN|nr:hypothetical protein [Actinopolymorpha pittospori]MBE1611911.1 signal transduction histidine kinase [Actinopolymorpha pittospori]